MAQLQDFPYCRPDVAGPDWRSGPCGRTRDSIALERANFEFLLNALEEIDPEYKDHETITWRHWACGWVEEIFTRPGSLCESIVEEIRFRLNEYPVLDEALLSTFENEEKEKERGANVA